VEPRGRPLPPGGRGRRGRARHRGLGAEHAGRRPSRLSATTVATPTDLAEADRVRYYAVSTSARRRFALPQEEITELLGRWQAGDQQAGDRLFASLYEELRAIAAASFRSESGRHTLQPTALVHEAYLKLVGLDRLHWQDRTHFLALAARAMRQVLVDHARRRNAQRRGSGRVETLVESKVSGMEQPADVLDLHRALESLEAIDPERARLVELRFFAGLTTEEAGAALGLAPRTVKRRWQSTRAWLQKELSKPATS
jgi:RNA polymerase sigma factor (TIGR02999 family)